MLSIFADALLIASRLPPLDHERTDWPSEPRHRKERASWLTYMGIKL